jgi:hypothetical protein
VAVDADLAIRLFLDGETLGVVRSAAASPRGADMGSQRPLTDFLSWLMEEPERLERYQTVEGFQELVDEWRLPQELQEILRNNDLRAAQEVVKEETGGESTVSHLFKTVIDF